MLAGGFLGHGRENAVPVAIEAEGDAVGGEQRVQTVEVTGGVLGQ